MAQDIPLRRFILSIEPFAVGLSDFRELLLQPAARCGSSSGIDSAAAVMVLLYVGTSSVSARRCRSFCIKRRRVNVMLR